jgi:hypothetical protein
LRNEVVPFRYARGAAGGDPVVIDGSLRVAGHFQQMGTNGVEAVMAGNSCVGVERFQQLEPFGWAVHHGCGDGVILRFFKKAKCASTSLLDHARYVSTPSFVPVIIKMYFMSSAPLFFSF